MKSLTDEQRSRIGKEPQPFRLRTSFGGQAGLERSGPAGFVAPQSRRHFGYAPSSLRAIQASLLQRDIFLFMRWVLKLTSLRRSDSTRWFAGTVLAGRACFRGAVNPPKQETSHAYPRHS